jgi:methylenetetrahydrofolate reductase (NADPH)
MGRGKRRISRVIGAESATSGFRTIVLQDRPLPVVRRRWQAVASHQRKAAGSMTTLSHLFAGYSIEATARDALDGLPSLALAPSHVYVPYLHEESDAQRVAACAALHRAGHAPVPHISARRVESVEGLDRFLGALAQDAGVRKVLLIAGDVARPTGPFADSLSVIATGLLERHGIAEVAIAGHPDGHADVPDAVLVAAMRDKLAALAERGMAARIVTQFSFDAGRVLDWLAELRAQGVTAPIRVGIPGPAGVRTLLRYAARCGVSSSASALARYGLSLGRLMGNAGPDRFLNALVEGGADVGLHVFPFGGFARFDEWLAGAVAPGRMVG